MKQADLGKRIQQEDEIRLLRCSELSKVQWIEAKLRKRAAENSMPITVREITVDPRKPTSGLRIESALNADILGTLAKYFQLKREVPYVRYVILGAGREKKLFRGENSLMKIQANKYGWEVRYLDHDQPAETIEACISQITTPHISNNERNTEMKETKIIIEALNKTENKELSLKENMIRYCVEVEHYTEEKAIETVEAIIKGTSEFTLAFDDIKGKSRETVAAAFKSRLEGKLNKLPEEDINKILLNLYVELMAFGKDKLAEIASRVNDESMKSAIKEIRQDCAAVFEGKSRNEKLDLITEAIENCGSMAALLERAEDE